MANPKIIEVIKSKEAKKRFEFLVNDQSVASIDYPKRFQKKAVLSAGNRQWQIQRTGFWKHTIEIAADQSPYSKVAAIQNWKGQISIRTDDNRQFHLKKKGFWKPAWHWLNEKEESVVELNPCVGWPKRKRGTITIHNSNDTTLTLLALIGWFVALTAQEDAAAMAAAG